MVTLQQFLKDGEPMGEFRPSPLYTPHGDSLTFYLKDEDGYGERIDDLLTIYKSTTDHEIIGCQVKGVRRKLERLKRLTLTLKAPRLELGLLFLAYMADADSPEARHQYEWLGEQAKNLGLELPTRELLTV